MLLCLVVCCGAHLSSLVSCDSEAHVRASVAMDAIVAALCESHPSTALAYASSSY
jgi:hypothetical protein